jgi:uncharacterized membrane protein YsdA (DUF1294 family)
MPLALAVLLLVLSMTALLGLLGYWIDKSDAAQQTPKVTEHK